jgi:MFS family permease
MDDTACSTDAVARPSVRARPSPWHLLGVALVIQCGFSALDQGVPMLTGFIKDDLAVSSTVAGLAVSSFLVGKVFGAYLAGMAADRYGEREVLIAAGCIAAVLVGIAVLMPVFILFPLLAAAGFASAAATPAGGRLVLLAFPRTRRGLALGIRQTGIPIAGLIVALTLPPLAHAAGWRWALAAAGAMMAVSVIPLYLTPTNGSSPPTAEAPRERRNVARNRDLRLLTVWGCLVVTGQYALIAYLALDVHETRHVSLAFAALAVAVAQATGIVGRVLWGALSDRRLAHGRRPLLLAVTGAGVASALTLFAMPATAPLFTVMIVAGFAGLALIGYQGLWVTMVTETSGPESVGAGTGFAVTFVVAAAALSPPFYGLVADVFGSYRAIWGALALVVALAFLPALLLRRT